MFKLQGEANSYDNIVSSSRAYLERYLCDLKEKADVRVLPGVITGTKPDSFRVSGYPGDYYRLALYELADIIFDSIPDDIALDITHGINFMPVLTVRATLEAAAYASLARSLKGDRTIRVSVYNSDPVQVPSNDPCKRSASDPCRPQGDCHPVNLTIHRIIAQKAGIPEIISAIDRLADEWKGNIPNIVTPVIGKDEILKKARRLNEDNRETVRKAIMLLKLFRHGLVPELLAFAAEEQGLEEAFKSVLQEALILWRNAISIRDVKGYTIVERRIRLWNGFEILVHALTLYRALKIGDALDTSLKTAIKLKDSYKMLGSSITSTIQNREIMKIERALKKLPGNKLTLSLASLYEIAGYGSYTGLSDCNVFLRDLLAHGGWHTSVIALEIENNSTRVRVAPDKACLEKSKPRSVWEVIWDKL